MTSSESDESYRAAADYESSEESSEEDDRSDKPSGSIQKHDWKHERTFASPAEAKEWIKDQGCWTKKKRYETAVGNKDVYRCNRVPACGTQCAKAIQLLYDAEGEEVILYVERKDHTHDEILEGGKALQRINSETKEVINRIIKQPPKDIRKALGDAKQTNQRIMVLSERQLYNYLEHSRCTFYVNINN